MPPSLASELRCAAQDAGVTRLALVGGVVRDLLLHQLHGVPWAGVPDLDWVVEGDALALTDALLPNQRGFHRSAVQLSRKPRDAAHP